VRPVRGRARGNTSGLTKLTGVDGSVVVDKDGFERAAADLVSHSTLPHLNGAYRQERSAPEGQQPTKEVGRPRPEAEYSEAEHSQDRQEAFQRIPQSDKTRVGDDAGNEKSDGCDNCNPGGGEQHSPATPGQTHAGPGT
jgi:hypothetical protein